MGRRGVRLRLHGDDFVSLVRVRIGRRMLECNAFRVVRGHPLPRRVFGRKFNGLAGASVGKPNCFLCHLKRCTSLSLFRAFRILHGKLDPLHRLCWHRDCHLRLRPSDRHLWGEQCSAGISERAYALWVLSSALFLGHSIIIDDMVFMVTQLVNVIALAVILVLARRFRNQICAEHARQLHIHE